MLEINHIQNMTINPKFKSLIPPLAEEEYRQLEANIIQHGCRDALTVWRGILIDGHNRFAICTEHKIEYRTQLIDLPDEEAVEDWMDANQLGRRNLTGDQASILRGRRYNRTKKDHGGDRKSSGQSEHLIPKTADTLAKQHGVSPSTIKRDGKKAKAVEALLVSDPEAAQAVLDGTRTLADLTKAAKAVVANEIRAQIAEQIAESPTSPTIVCADALRWLDTIEDGSCDMLLTDPLYSTDVPDIRQYADSWLPKAWAKIKDTGRGYVFIGRYPEEIAAYIACCKEHKIPLEQLLIWTYNNTLGPKPLYSYFGNYQVVLYLLGPEAKSLDCDLLTELCCSQTLPHPARSVERVYQWQKPDDLIEAYIRHATEPGEMVIDPFAGSGTSLICASRLGRNSIGCEILPQVVAIAVARGCVDGGAR